MNSDEVEDACPIPFLCEYAIKSQENEAEDKAVVLKMSMIYEDSIGFEQKDQ